MKRGARQLAALVAALFLLLRCGPAFGEELSLDQYRQQLRELTRQIDSLAGHPEQAIATEAGVPDQVKVKSGETEITVNYRDLKNDLVAFSKADAQKRSGMLLQIQNYVYALRGEADSFEQGPDTVSARPKLTAILARAEFRKADRGPSAKDILLAKIFGWLLRLLSKLPIAGRSRLDVLQFLIYLLIGAALSLLFIWTVRRLRRPREEPATREIIPFAPSARSWHVWLAEARALAQQQDWRGAIHLAYWAGISFLEERGTWKPDRARTPREYLRLVGLRSSRYPALAALTGKFEVVWYGHRDAGEPDFQETLGELEKLGCR